MAGRERLNMMTLKYSRNLGIMVRGDHSGLGAQTRRMTQLIRPERILYIDSTPFAKNTKQNFDWYDGFSGYKVVGFPNNKEVAKFMQGLTHFICCENPHNFYFYQYAKQHNIKTFCVVNYEFCDNLAHPEYPEPDYFIMPSYWKLKEMQDRYGKERVIYLPPPIDPNEFKNAREVNLNRKDRQPKFLHIIGTLAAHDRNGTLDLLQALKHTQQDFSLIIKSQHPLPKEYITNDPRVTYKIGSDPDNQSLYSDFDALILPRRYGGLCLVMNEALMSGLPVIMPNISPQSGILHNADFATLVEAKVINQFMARVPIDIYGCDPYDLASAINRFIASNNNTAKVSAFDFAYNEYGNTSLAERYNQLWQL
jgi:glycosyltransferase involved in cell wall biosynthesis